MSGLKALAADGGHSRSGRSMKRYVYLLNVYGEMPLLSTGKCPSRLLSSVRNKRDTGGACILPELLVGSSPAGIEL